MPRNDRETLLLRIRMKLAATLSIAALGLGACATPGTDSGSAGDFQVYGNWCGPGHPKPGTKPTPINQVDSACRAHDQCYGFHGYLNRGCDDQLMSTLRSIQTSDPLEDAARRAIIVYFENSPKVD
jgi:hypothetical protein